MHTLDNGKHGRTPTSEAEHMQEPFWRVAPVAKAALPPHRGLRWLCAGNRTDTIPGLPYGLS